MPTVRTLIATGFASLGVLAVSGCQSTLVVDPAPHATDSACADVMLRLPDSIGDLQDRKTSSQATEAWGDPSAAILRCGMDEIAPTTDPCVTVDGVDWVSVSEDDEAEDDHTWRFMSFGRSPAVEVLIDTTQLSGAEVLSAVSPAVANLESTGQCVAASDLDDSQSPLPHPTESASTESAAAEQG